MTEPIRWLYGGQTVYDVTKGGFFNKFINNLGQRKCAYKEGNAYTGGDYMGGWLYTIPYNFYDF